MNFRYYCPRFKAYPTGTHWYHSHYGTQRTDGLFGALVILERPKNSEHNKTPKDNKFKGKSKAKDDTVRTMADNEEFICD